jgi:Uma2 family endonuclease
MATDSKVLHLSRDDAGRFLSAEEFAAAECSTPWKYERIGGKLVVMSPKSPEHDDSLELLRDMLVAYKLSHPGRIERIVSESWIRSDSENDLIPDLAVYLRGSRQSIKRPNRVPELVIEVLSPGRRAEVRGYVIKRAAYHRWAVLEYLIVDRFDRTVTVLTRTESGYAERVLDPAGSYSTPLLPGLEISNCDVFADEGAEP